MHLRAMAAPNCAGFDIDLGIDPGTVGMVVSQELSDILKRSAVAKHSCRQCVPQHMGGTARGPLDPGPCHGTSDNAANC